LKRIGKKKKNDKKKETKQRRGKIGKYGQIKKNPVRRGKEEYKKGEKKENKK
jgi:hypothetical protein